MIIGQERNVQILAAIQRHMKYIGAMFPFVPFFCLYLVGLYGRTTRASWHAFSGSSAVNSVKTVETNSYVSVFAECHTHTYIAIDRKLLEL